MSGEKVVTYADLETLRTMREKLTVTASSRANLLDRLIEAAEADAPELPEGWVLRKGGGVHYHRDGEAFLNAECRTLTWNCDDLAAARSDFTPLRPSITPADLTAAVDTLSTSLPQQTNEDITRDMFKAAGVEVSDR